MSCRILSLHNMCTSTLHVQSWILQQEIQSFSPVARAIFIESLKADKYIKLVIHKVWFSKTMHYIEHGSNISFMCLDLSVSRETLLSSCNLGIPENFFAILKGLPTAEAQRNVSTVNLENLALPMITNVGSLHLPPFPP